MVVPSWDLVLLRVQATQGVSNMVVPSWGHVFLRVQAAQGYLTWRRAQEGPGAPGGFTRAKEAPGGSRTLAFADLLFQLLAFQYANRI